MSSDEQREEFWRLLTESLAQGSFVKLTLGKYRGDEEGLRNLYARLVTIKDEAHLSFLYRYQTKDITKNYRRAEGLKLISELLGESFLSARLFTTEGDWQLEFNRKRKARLSASRATFSAPPPREHDRQKKRFLDPQESLYLRALGVTTEQGAVKERMQDKWRQINKFVEIVAGLFDLSPLAERQEIAVLDMGSGKGYLTFAVYDYFDNERGIRARLTGVEARRELVEFCNEVARQAGFADLHFAQGNIRDYAVERADILIALHACNTATDEAIYKGIAAGAAIIICAPCCHQQIRPQIEPPPALRGLLKHGILLEREAETVTDGLRALLLERSGYTTKVFEFISTEHTQKNTMIVGVKRKRATDTALVARQIEEIKQLYGIKEHSLERLLANHASSAEAQAHAV